MEVRGFVKMLKTVNQLEKAFDKERCKGKRLCIALSWYENTFSLSLFTKSYTKKIDQGTTPIACCDDERPPPDSTIATYPYPDFVFP